MTDTWRQRDLPEIATHLAARPGHERVRTLMAEMLRHGFGADYLALEQEVRLPEVHGRIDTLFGATVFEFKRDLRQEQGDVNARLPDYLAERQRQTGRRYLGIATDGATFIAYELREGRLAEIGRHETRRSDGEALLLWLEPALSARDDLEASPLVVQRELGRESLTFGRARAVLERLWATHGDHPEARLKRQLWNGLLREAYGDSVGDDVLFLQHTYLTIVAKTAATRILGIDENDPRRILSGDALRDDGIHGAVESDFFDWVLADADGADLVRRIARQTGRFRLRDARVDVLKALYESLIDPAQRHDLGEYYTPDWLAAKVVRAAVAAPLTDVVLDPACGSGTFLFHAIRRLIGAAAAESWPEARIVQACARQVRGLDIHPVAVIIARVTWLLALGEIVLKRGEALHVPVFLGDAMQWNLRLTGDVRDVVVPVPDSRPLHIPAGFAEDQDRFDPGLRALTEGLNDQSTPEVVGRRLRRIPGVSAADADAMQQTFADLQDLFRQGRDGIWPYVFRNLVRPVWLSRPGQRADVVLGNPPWVAYRHLSAELKARLREACQRMNLWAGGKLATQQDLSALFWARAAERYLALGGTIAFVMPYAALNRPAFAGLRAGDYRDAQVRIEAAWSFDEKVQPLFPVPASVLIGRRGPPQALLATVLRYAGTLPRRDATEPEADRALTVITAPWPPIPTMAGASPYRSRFRQGATLVPRRFVLVQRENGRRLGSNPQAPRVSGRVGNSDKAPWKNVEPPSGPVEARFLRPVLLGETIAPYRLLPAALGVVPLEQDHVMDSTEADSAGYRGLARWLRSVEEKWNSVAERKTDGTLRMTLRQRFDYMRGLSLQASGSDNPRIVYPKAGTILCAAILGDQTIVIDHMAYWAMARGMAEARYVVAVLNADTVVRRISAMQPKGQGGARHFDLLPWELPIPEFNPRSRLHVSLADAAAEAEVIAVGVTFPEGAHFTAKRRAIREALLAAGVAQRIEAMVRRLLGQAE